MASKMAITPRYCIQHSRFTKQDGWRLWDLSLSLNGNIAVTGYNVNTDRTYIDVYTNVRHSDSRDKPKIIYSKEFEKYSDERWIYVDQMVSFIDDDILVSCLGYKLEVFQVNKDEVLRSRRVNGEAKCLSVRERREIFIGFDESNKITVYDVIDLNEIKSIILQGIQDGCFPYDMTAIADRIFVCVVGAGGKEGRNNKSLIFEEKNGRILSELTKPTDTVQWYVFGLALNITLNVIAVAWSQTFKGTRKGKDVIVFYSLLSENNCSFLIVEVEFGVSRIRISDRGDRIVCKDRVTEECKVYDMAEVFTYSHFKEKLASTLQTDECTKLANFFKIPKDQTYASLGSEKSSENLLLALEEKGILQPYNVDRLIKAFEELTINPCCVHVAEIFLKTRSPAFYIELIQKLEEKISMIQTASEDETRQLKEKTSAIEDLQKELQKLQEAHLKVTQEREKLEAERDEASAFHKERLEELEEKISMVRKASEDERRNLKEKTTEVENLQKELKELRKSQETQLKVTQEREKLKAELGERQLQVSSLQKELRDSKKVKAETEKVLKQTEELLQKVIQEKNEIKTELKQVQVERSLGSMSLEEERKNQAEIGKKALRGATVGNSSTPSPNKSKYLSESELQDEFAKVVVTVSTRLTRTNCVYLARYFNFSRAKVAFIQEESKTPGLDLLDTLQERHIISMHNVTRFQKALVDLELKEIEETLISPYHRKIDPRVCERYKVLHQEK